MNNKAFTISFIVAILAVSMVYSYVDSTKESLMQQFGTEVPVVVAKKEIKELDVLDDTNLWIKPVPRNFVQPGAGKSLEEFKGGMAIAPISAGEQVTRTKVTYLGARTGLARQIAIGKRAVTIPVGDDAGVAKLIKPGDRVDVLANIDLQSGNKMAMQVKTLLQDVLVLATGKYVTNTVPGILESDPMRGDQKQKLRLSEYTNFSNVTLEVDPFQAQTLVFAKLALGGQIYLVLRNNDDTMKESLQTTMAVDVLGAEGTARKNQADLENERRKNLQEQQKKLPGAPTSGR